MNERQPTNPSGDGHDDQMDLIVAYLDGELSPAQSAEVERRLGSDETFRRKLQDAEETWFMLDQLPRATVDDNFCKTTMELVVDQARKDVETKTRELPVMRRRTRRLSWLGAAAAAAVCFLFLRVLAGAPNRILLENLPQVYYLDVYSQFDGVEMLEGLNRLTGGAEWAPGMSENQLQEALDEFSAVSDEKQREAFVLNLDAGQKSALRAKLNRYRMLPQEERQRMKDLHEQIAAAPDEENLLSMLLQYRHWMAGLEEAERYGLRQLDDAQQAEEVYRMAGKQSMRLTEEEIKGLQQLMRQVAPEYHQRMREQPRHNRSGNPREILKRIVEDRQRWAELYAEVRGIVSEQKREMLSSLPPEEVPRVVLSWFFQAAMAGRDREVSERDLEEFFASDQLSEEDRVRLLAMPAEDMDRALRLMYRLRTDQPEGRPFSGPRRGEGMPRNGFGPPEGGMPREGFGRPENGVPREGFGPPGAGPLGPGPPFGEGRRGRGRFQPPPPDPPPPAKRGEGRE